MSDEMKAQASGAINGDQAAPVTQAPATDADWKAERIKAQRQAKAAIAEAEQLRTKLAEFENAKKSEQEKAIEAATKAAREATLAEVNGTILQKDIRTEIRLKLAEAGVPANQVAVVIEESNPETVEDAVTAATAYADKWKTEIAKPNTPSGTPGSPSSRAPSNRPWSNQKVNEYIRQHGHLAIANIRSEITEDQKRGVYIRD